MYGLSLFTIVVGNWRGFAQKFDPYRRVVSWLARIPWKRMAEKLIITADKWPIVLWFFGAKKAVMFIRAIRSNY